MSHLFSDFKRSQMIRGFNWLNPILFLVTLTSPGAARAHAILIDSVPTHRAALGEAPQTITLRFNAALEPALTQVYLVNPQEIRTPLEMTGDSAVNTIVVRVPPLTAGVYTVVYKVLARDGHVTEGSVRFTILGR